VAGKWFAFSHLEFELLNKLFVFGSGLILKNKKKGKVNN